MKVIFPDIDGVLLLLKIIQFKIFQKLLTLYARRSTI